jgi:hypothetical protein
MPPPVTDPPPVYVPLPLDPFSVKCVESVTVIVKAPFAAVFPRTPSLTTFWPVLSPCGTVVPIDMGDV